MREILIKMRDIVLFYFNCNLVTRHVRESLLSIHDQMVKALELNWMYVDEILR